MPDKSAGDLYFERLREWFTHCLACDADTCETCAVVLNQTRLAAKVWEQSRHKSLGVAAEAARLQQGADDARPNGAEEQGIEAPRFASAQLKEIGEMAMLAYSDPHATAAQYREALRQICTRALDPPDPDAAIDDLLLCQQILSADMTRQPTSAPLPEPNFPIPVNTVAFSLYSVIQELRAHRAALLSR